MFDTSGYLGDLQPGSFDKIIVAGSVHENRHQEDTEFFVVANLGPLQSRDTLFISVSLAAAFDDGALDAQSYVDEFIEKTGWRPDQSLKVAGAVRHGEYGYYKEQVLKHHVLGERPIEDPQSDHEFTDWKSLAKSIDGFVGT